eukprot:CAMPEP_0182909362 /NCGR_PEP_ID=MMETSP0034_2-20130328/35708_1 /TAXON_ID=156128 /ORGANISM="Nephroselmis pyriformis, Strain CCMP717" /LENGTH=251 /DNA_ID=CAMNT_0025045609 /DNA_START=178 /DNA_END=934 /DNA_ORIENTATION=+
MQRIIARLDIKGQNVVKGLHLEGLRVVGDPSELALTYHEQGADEILYIDVVASLYGRANILEVVRRTISKGVFVPLTVGGGVRNIEDIKMILRAGADKVAINTGAIKDPKFIQESSRVFGAQCIVGSIQANKWEAYFDGGRERSYKDVISWAKELESLGVGELLITSIDKDGTRCGLDYALIKAVTAAVRIPVVASSGAGSTSHVTKSLEGCEVSGICIGAALHYKSLSIFELKRDLLNLNVAVGQLTNVP